MKLKCNYCGSLMNDYESVCPKCGAPASGAGRTASEQPKTIDELKEWYKSMNLPPEETTRFFIGKDIHEPRAFGIYKDNLGDFIVYKNKTDGTRAIRYQGSDEAYAVNELYQKLKIEIVNQKSLNSYHTKTGGITGDLCPNKTSLTKKLIPVFIIFITLLLIGIISFVNITNTNPKRGYYQYGGNDWYYDGSYWSTYDSYNDSWYLSDYVPSIDKDNQSYYSIPSNEHVGSSYTPTYDSSWDSSDSWSSSDSWDSGGSDWDSDW